MDIGVLTFVTLALLIFAVHATVRAVRRRQWEGAKGRAWWAAILIAVTLVALWFEVGHDRQQLLATSAMSARHRQPSSARRLPEVHGNVLQPGRARRLRRARHL